MVPMIDQKRIDTFQQQKNVKDEIEAFIKLITPNHTNTHTSCRHMKIKINLDSINRLK